MTRSRLWPLALAAIGLGLAAAGVTRFSAPGPERLSLELTGSGGEWQAFFDGGAGFREIDSQWAEPRIPPESGDGGPSRLSLPLPAWPVDRLRLDPPQNGQWRIAHLCLDGGTLPVTATCAAGPELKAGLSESHHVPRPRVVDAALVVATEGDDPWLVWGDLVPRLRTQFGPRRRQDAEQVGLGVGLLSLAALLAVRRWPRLRSPLLAASLVSLALARVTRWPVTVEITVREDSLEEWQLFWDGKRGIAQVDSVTALPSAPETDGMRHVALGLPGFEGAWLRLDPPAQSGTFHVGRMCAERSWPVAWLGSHRSCLSPRELLEQFPGRSGLKRAESVAELLELEADSLDPQLLSGSEAARWLASKSVVRSWDRVACALAAAGLAFAWSSLGLGTRRRLRESAAWVAVMVIVPWLGVEVVLFAAEPWLPGNWANFDPDLGFVARPYGDRTNRFGFPDRDYPLERRPGTCRILALSDSFNWMGRGGHNYTDLIEASLARRYGSDRVELISAGFPMTGAAQEKLILQKWGLLYQPDLVLLGVYVGNDFTDSDPSVRRVVVGDSWVDLDSSRPVPTWFGRPLLPVSRLALALEKRFTLWGSGFGEDEESFALAERDYMQDQRGAIVFWSRQARSGKALTLASFDQSIRDMVALSRGAGASFAIAAFPAVWTVDPREARRLLDTLPLPAADFDLAEGHRRLADLARELQVPLFDLKQPFTQAIASGQSLYLHNDGHWNRAGNVLAAAALLEPVARLVEASGRLSGPSGDAPRGQASGLRALTPKRRGK